MYGQQGYPGDPGSPMHQPHPVQALGRPPVQQPARPLSSRLTDLEAQIENLHTCTSRLMDRLQPILSQSPPANAIQGIVGHAPSTGPMLPPSEIELRVMNFTDRLHIIMGLILSIEDRAAV